MAGTLLDIKVGPFKFIASLQEESAPQTCAALRKMLPFQNKLIQARWSGEAAWVPMGDFPVGVGYENHTSHPAPGELLLYTGNLSETEILFPYGACLFSSKLGQLAGNHFATIVEGQHQLKKMGQLVLWEGAQDILIELISSDS
jgi:hypothetical protein